MTSPTTTTKLRVVRCPKCRMLLPELPGVSLYRCGECGTILQAKSRKGVTKDAASRSRETEDAQKKEQDCVSEDKEAGNVNQKAIVPSTGESTFKKSSGAEQNDNDDQSSVARKHIEVNEESSLDQNKKRNKKESGGLNFSREVSSPTKLNSKKNEELSPTDGEDSEVDENKYALVRRNRRNQNKFGDHNKERPRNIIVSDEFSSSSEVSFHENQGTNETESGDCNSEDEELFPESEIPIGLEENVYSLEQKDGMVQSEYGDYNRETYGSTNVSTEVSSSPEPTFHEIQDPSPIAGEDEDFKSRFLIRSSNTENLLASGPKDQIIAAQSPMGESISPDNLNGFDRISSVDTLENSLVNPNDELNTKHRSEGKSPKTRSYFAYESSVSSFGESDDQVPDQHRNVLERSFEEVIPGRDDAYMLHDMMISDSEMRRQERNYSSISLERKHDDMKASKWDQDGWPGPTRNHARKSRLPLYSRGYREGFENGNPSNYEHKDFECSSSFQLPGKAKYLEEEKMELLRTVHKLQNQLNKLEISKERPNGSFRKEKRIPPYYDQITPEDELCHDSKYHGHPRRYSQGQPRPLQCKMTKMPFSGEVIIGRHPIGHSCSCCCPQDRHYSEPLPPHAKFYNKGKYTALHNHKCRNCHQSSPSSPQHFSGSEISSWSHDTEFFGNRRKSREVKKSYLMGQRRHFLPIAGGSPFVACYHCSELLQLPSDSLIYRRKFHQLQCSACLKVLKFSLQNKTHIVPYTPGVTVAPPPSEVDDHRHPGPMSSSDHYDVSFVRNHSSEAEHFLRKPKFGIPNRSSDDKKKRNVMKISDNKHKNPVETFESAGTSSKMSKAENSSEIVEEVPRRAGSPLHRLMGYSTPSQVIR